MDSEYDILTRKLPDFNEIVPQITVDLHARAFMDRWQHLYLLLPAYRAPTGQKCFKILRIFNFRPTVCQTL